MSPDLEITLLPGTSHLYFHEYQAKMDGPEGLKKSAERRLERPRYVSTDTCYATTALIASAEPYVLSTINQMTHLPKSSCKESNIRSDSLQPEAFSSHALTFPVDLESPVNMPGLDNFMAFPGTVNIPTSNSSKKVMRRPPTTTQRAPYPNWI
ncbi:hypothetical protein EV356DRAFT_267772 [Viridothelium virens]|uniref:Uncharacterized protein n=1 Tax=Viridothelium virens TaxID=1048519 RepID=A0A6A6HLI6_VIRVR|nr:hypothetical protein EV356DRAFT_267772 [Viridothelium virens]